MFGRSAPAPEQPHAERRRQVVRSPDGTIGYAGRGLHGPGDLHARQKLNQ